MEKKDSGESNNKSRPDDTRFGRMRRNMRRQLDTLSGLFREDSARTLDLTEAASASPVPISRENSGNLTRENSASLSRQNSTSPLTTDKSNTSGKNKNSERPGEEELPTVTVPARPQSAMPMKFSQSIEMMTMTKNEDGEIVVTEVKTPEAAPSAPPLTGTKTPPGTLRNPGTLRREKSESMVIKDKLYGLNVVALQAEELLQWLFHQFGETIPGLDEVGLQNKIQMIRMIPHHISVYKNLLALEEMILQLLRQFKHPDFATRDRAFSISMS